MRRQCKNAEQAHSYSPIFLQNSAEVASTVEPVEPAEPLTLESLYSSISGMTDYRDWTIHRGESTVQIYKLVTLPSSSKSPPALSHCLTLKHDLTWDLFINGRCVTTSTCRALATTPTTLDLERLNILLKLVEGLHICAGHPDDKFVALADERHGSLGKAFLDRSSVVALNGTSYNCTLRSCECEMLTHGSKCSECVRYRSTLRALYNRHIKRKNRTTISPSHSHANDRSVHAQDRKMAGGVAFFNTGTHLS